MTLNVLALPVDIPWKRICVSDDMTDGSLCDAHMPPRWRSSIAIFSYQPPEEDQTYDDMLVSYIKVTCSITGYQYQARDRMEVGLERRRGSYWTKGKVTNDYEAQIYKYYACNGALLQVSVGSKTREAMAGVDAVLVNPNHGPYFADFEPKKRELYELVTETGEVMSRSLEATNVRKGTTTTDAHEVLDSVNLSVNASQTSGVKQAQQPETTHSGGIETGSKTRDLSQQEISNLRTTDQGREMRETYSHTTQLTQMYHQLTSYHVGTNRAMFFMLPRPHIIQPKDEDNKPIYTFVNGPRELEGIQEFFFVVMRPKTMEDVCIEAYLETAHIGRVPTREPKEKKSDPFYFQKLESKVEDRDPFIDLEGESDSYTNPPLPRSETYSVPAGWEIDFDAYDGNGYKITAIRAIGKTTIFPIEVDANHLTITCDAIGEFIDDSSGNKIINASIEVDLTVFIRTIEQKTVASTDKLFLTGRGLCCCPGDTHHLGTELTKMGKLMSESVVFEKPLNMRRTDGARMEPGPSHGGMSIVEANLMRNEIGKEMMASMNSTDRYPRGMIGLAETQFVAATVADSIISKDHPDNQDVRSIPGLDPELARRLAAVAPRVHRARLLRMSAQEQMDRFDLSVEEVVSLRRALVGVSGPFRHPRSRWTKEPERIAPTVPDMRGLSKDEAAIALGRAGLGLGSVNYRDTDEACSIVIEQIPAAGENTTQAFKVDLVIASGASVRLPNVVGATLTDALVALRDAGLRSQPEVALTESYTPRRRIKSMDPGAGARVASNAQVVLTVE